MARTLPKFLCCLCIICFVLFCLLCVCVCVNVFMYLHRASWYSLGTLTEVFPCFFLSCKANATVKPAKMGHGLHSSKIFVFYVLFVLCCCVYCVCVCVCVCVNVFIYLLCASWCSSATLTEVFPCFFLSCKANATVKPAKMGHGPHSSQIFVLFYVLFVLCCSVYCVCVCVCV